MWRKTVLHFHTTPNERTTAAFDADAIVARAQSEAVAVLAITDHNSVDRVSDVQAASEGTPVEVIAGMEADTDRGHLVLLAPGPDGESILRELAARAGIQPGSERHFSEVVSVVRSERGAAGPYRDGVVMIGAHVDQPGSLLQAQQTLSSERQVEEALMLDAVEVVSSGTRAQYIASGLKNSGRMHSIIAASDVHVSTDTLYATWMYLPDVSAMALRHAFCVPEATIRFEEPQDSPKYTIDSVAIDGGMHHGRTFSFDSRTTAVIGAPSTGKSLLVDAIRFVFGFECPIDEVQRVSNSRLNRSLATGTTVTVSGTADGVEYQLARTWGGAQPVEPPFQPIIFGQTELVRRAMEREPAMNLLDIHCPDVRPLLRRATATRESLKDRFRNAIELARSYRALSDTVENPEDGLEATKDRLSALSGSEVLARKALEVGRIRAWRASAHAAVDAWESGYTGIPQPEIPSAPSVDPSVLDSAPFFPIDALNAELITTSQTSIDLVKSSAVRLRELISEHEDELVTLESEIQDELQAAGFGEGSALLAQLEMFRTRLEQLEADSTELANTRTALEKVEQEIVGLVGESDVVRTDLRAARGRGCSAVNASIRTFRTRLHHDAYSERIDGLLEQAKTGTYQRTSALGGVRDTLDRVRLLHVAVLHAANRDDEIPPVEGMEQQDDIACTALDRSREDALAELAGSWPEDGLIIETKDGGDSYPTLTEGMRALAIKEVSFANNALPVVTDQPEDAVPPQNVFQDLVPSIRKQRVSRQFILASHDANIVVASDVERVIVMPTGDDDLLTGSLHDTEIRRASMELLEGGLEAFELRKQRYGS